MSRIAALFRWLGTPIRATRALFPFTQDGRQTLIYLIFAGAGPALTLLALRILDQTRADGQWDAYTATADRVGYSLLIVVAALGTYVAWRAIRIDKDGFSAESKDAPAAAQAVADKAQETADQIKEETSQ